MHVRICIAGHSATWRFRGSQALEDWLGERPWQRSGGHRLIRLGGDGEFADFADLMTNTVRALDEGATLPRVVVLDAGNGALREKVGQALEVGVSPQHHTFLRAVEQAVRTRPAVLLLPPAWTRAQPPGLLDEVESLVEHVAKLGEGQAGLTLLVCDVGGPLRRSDDWSTGGPMGAVLEVADAGPEALWRAYLHARIAWEACGGPTLIREFEATLKSELRSDDELEQALNTWAVTKHEAVRAAVHGYLQAHLDPSLASASARRALNEAELEDERLLWCAPGEGRLRIAPWMARAMLLRQPSTNLRPLLRAALVCAPLGRELLLRCFDLEAQERAACMRERGNEKASDDAAGLFRSFQGGEQGSAAAFYPRGCPMKPNSALEFESLGEFLRSVSVPAGRRNAQRELLRLRNALAHGHYVSWRCVEAFLGAQRVLHR